MGPVSWVSVTLVLFSMQVALAENLIEAEALVSHARRPNGQLSGPVSDPFRIEGPKPKTAIFSEEDIKRIQRLFLPAMQKDRAYNRSATSAIFDPVAGRIKHPTLFTEVQQLDSPSRAYLKQQLKLQASHPPKGLVLPPQQRWTELSEAVLKAIYLAEQKQSLKVEDQLLNWKNQKSKDVLLKEKEDVEEALDKQSMLLARLKEWQKEALAAYLKQTNFKPASERELLAFLEREVKYAEGQTEALRLLLTLNQITTIQNGVTDLENQQRILSQSLFSDRLKSRKLGEFNRHKDILSKGQSIWTDMPLDQFKLEIKDMHWTDRRELENHLVEAKRATNLNRRDSARYQQLREKAHELDFYVSLGSDPARSWTEMILSDPDRNYILGSITREQMEDYLEKTGEKGRNDIRALIAKKATETRYPDAIKALKKLDRQYFKDVCDPKYPLDINLALQESWTLERDTEIKQALENFKGTSAAAIEVISEIETKFGPLLGNRCGVSRELYPDLGHTINLSHTEYRDRMEKARKILRKRGDENFRYSSLRESYPRWMNKNRKAAHSKKNHWFPGYFDSFSRKARLSDTQTLLALQRYLREELDKIPFGKRNIKHGPYFEYIRKQNLISSVLGYRYGKRYDHFLPLLENALAFIQSVQKLRDDELKELYDYLGQVPHEYLRRKHQKPDLDSKEIEKEKGPYNRARNIIVGEYIRRLDTRNLSGKVKPGTPPKRAIFPWLALPPNTIKKYFENLQPMEDNPDTPDVNEAKLDQIPQWTLLEAIQDMQKRVTDHFGGDKLEDAAKVRALFQGPQVVMDNALHDKVKDLYKLEMKEQWVKDRKGNDIQVHFWDFSKTELSPSKIQTDPFLCRTLIQINPGSRLDLTSQQARTCERAKALGMDLPRCKKFEKTRPDVDEEENLCALLADPERDEAVVVGNWVIGPSHGKDKKFALWPLDEYNKETKELSEQFEEHLIEFLKASNRANSGLAGTWTYLQKAFSDDPNFKTDDEKWMNEQFKEANEIIDIFRKKYGLKRYNIQALFSALQQVLKKNGENIEAQIEFLDNRVRPGAIFLAIALPLAIWAAPITVAVGATLAGGADVALQWAENRDAVAKGERPKGWNPVRTVFVGSVGGLAAPAFVALPELMLVGGIGFGAKHGLEAAVHFNKGETHQGWVNLGLAGLSFFWGPIRSKEPSLWQRFEGTLG